MARSKKYNNYTQEYAPRRDRGSSPVIYSANYERSGENKSLLIFKIVTHKNILYPDIHKLGHIDFLFYSILSRNNSIIPYIVSSSSASNASGSVVYVNACLTIACDLSCSSINIAKKIL